MDSTDPGAPDRDGDAVRDTLGRAAGRVEVPAMPIAREQVRHRAARRTRRTRAVVAVAAAGALAAGGVLVAAALRDDGRPTSVSEAPVSEPTDTEPATTVLGREGVPSATDPSVTGPTLVAAEVPTSDSVPSDSAAEAALDAATWSGPSAAAEQVDTELVRTTVEHVADQWSVEWLVPWRDGFLVSSRQPVEQPLPDELPAEISERFSQEVRDLFADGLPATVQEATEMLQDAGLFEEVSQLVLADQEVYDAIYGDAEFSAAPPADVRFSDDAHNWQPVEFALPDGFQPSGVAASTGDRLALLGSPIPQAPDETMAQPVLLASTTDLVAWEIVEIDDAAPPTQLPPSFDYYVWAQSLSVHGDRWIVQVEQMIEPRIDDFVPSDLIDNGFSTEFDGDGLTVTSGDGVTGERFTVTWEEMGAGPELVAHLTGRDRTGSAAISGSWGDGASPPTSATGRWWSAVAAEDGFYALSGEAVEFSVDGATWEAVPIPEDHWISSLVVLNGRVAAVLESVPESSEAQPQTRLFLLAGSDDPPELVDVDLPAGGGVVGSPQTTSDAVVIERWTDDGVSRWVLAVSPDWRWILEELPAVDPDTAGPTYATRNGTTVLAFSDGDMFASDLS